MVYYQLFVLFGLNLPNTLGCHGNLMEFVYISSRWSIGFSLKWGLNSTTLRHRLYNYLIHLSWRCQHIQRETANEPWPLKLNVLNFSHSAQWKISAQVVVGKDWNTYVSMRFHHLPSSNHLKYSRVEDYVYYVRGQQADCWLAHDWPASRFLLWTRAWGTVRNPQFQAPTWTNQLLCSTLNFGIMQPLEFLGPT